MNEIDRTLLHALGVKQLREVISALASGANPNVRASDGERPLTLAARMPRGAQLIKVLLDHGATVEVMNKAGQTPLMAAAAAGRHANARVLLAAAADANRINRKRETALTYAVVWRRTKVIEALLLHGADVENPPPPQWSPLMYAAFEGNTRIVDLLLKSGAKQERKDGYGRDARMIAQGAHRWAVMRILDSS